MAGDEDLIKSAEAFQKLYQAKWSEFISHCALSTISDLKYNKLDNLPLTEDIQKLHKHLDKNAELANAALKKVATVQNYSNLAHTTLTKIVLFNRRRIGEVSKMKLRNFLERDHSNTHERLGLLDYEQKLCNYFERVELKGKRGRKVAVQLTPEMSAALNLNLQFYRLSEPTIQSGKISKLLLALEKGQLHELQGKSLDQIGDIYAKLC